MKNLLTFHFLNTNNVCSGFLIKEVNQLSDLHIEAHIVSAHCKLAYTSIVFTSCGVSNWCFEAGVQMRTPPAQVLLKMVAGLFTGSTLGTKTNFVNLTWHPDNRIDEH